MLAKKKGYDKPWRDAMSKPKKIKDPATYRDSMSNPLPEGEDSINAMELKDNNSLAGSPHMSISRPYQN